MKKQLFAKPLHEEMDRLLEKSVIPCSGEYAAVMDRNSNAGGISQKRPSIKGQQPQKEELTNSFSVSGTLLAEDSASDSAAVTASSSDSGE